MGAGGSTSQRYYLHNWRGDVIKLTDNTGRATQVYDYDAFGVPVHDVLVVADEVVTDGAGNSTEIRNIPYIGLVEVNNTTPSIVEIPLLGGLFDVFRATIGIDHRTLAPGTIADPVTAERAVVMESGGGFASVGGVRYTREMAEEHRKARFRVLLDDVQVYDSGILAFWNTRNIELNVANARKMTLITENVSDMQWSIRLFANWANAQLLRQASDDSNPFRYCGEYHDAETRTIYLRNR
jgi:hypothetical protein